MSELRPSILRETGLSSVPDYKRIRALTDDLRARFRALGLDGAYALFTHPVFSRWASPAEVEVNSLTHDTRPRVMVSPPEYPEQKPAENDMLYRRRVERFHEKNRAYRAFAREVVEDGIERLVEELEKLSSKGEFFHQPQTSTLQTVEKVWSKCELPVYAAKLAGKTDWHLLLPPPPPVPYGTQLSMF